MNELGIIQQWVDKIKPSLFCDGSLLPTTNVERAFEFCKGTKLTARYEGKTLTVANKGKIDSFALFMMST